MLLRMRMKALVVLFVFSMLTGCLGTYTPTTGL